MKSIFISIAAALVVVAAVPCAVAQTPKQGGGAVVTFNNDLDDARSPCRL